MVFCWHVPRLMVEPHKQPGIPAVEQKSVPFLDCSSQFVVYLRLVVALVHLKQCDCQCIVCCGDLWSKVTPLRNRRVLVRVC